MPDEPFLAATKASYDVMAAEYADMVSSDLDAKPLDRALLAAFTELVKAGGNGPVADVGCGPGQATAVLRRLGVDAFGIDLSPGMIDLARRTYPDLRFEVGSMLALGLPEGSMGGLLAYYSIIHVPWERRSEVFSEFHRVLAPGGQVMLVFQVGDDRGHRSEAFGKAICLDWYRQQPDEIANLLRRAGFEVWATVTRQPDAAEKTPQGYVLARKPLSEPVELDEARGLADEGLYVRFQSTVRNERGYFTGVFGLVNGLARNGKLTAEQERLRRAHNDWYNAAYPDPSSADPTVYDRELHPGAAAWFKSTSRDLIKRVDGYLEILAAHEIGWRMMRSSDPGRIVYEDEYQIVVVPHEAGPGPSAIRDRDG
ncbi:methyltransferase domain-containing protein [Streptomyces sp. 110]|uniref:Methyltransferase domain-containing protein n=1 Tax=Streptomyces endocoffeicus TaxID=2898945 RepID=A0ABS1Q9C4_9ACTN|nr:class I SAM-dependent methyltransferase [Streptomyces endocoffeicus]MBL1120521.1 methyltransferase domain-containing protein [Streptomyces endocoffeicus]